MSTPQTTDYTQVESIKIGPEDPQYLAVINKQFNKRHMRDQTMSAS